MKGAIVENFVGEEIVSYDNPYIKKNLFYWNREITIEKNGEKQMQK